MYIVSGASSGIGRAVAGEIASRNLEVLAIARRSEQLASLQKQYHSRVRTLCADLTTRDGVDAVLSAIPGRTQIRGIVHSAGSVVPSEPYNAIYPEELVEHFRIHVGSPLAIHQVVSREHKIDRVVFIDSYSASTPRHGWAGYSIVKAAAQMSAKCAAQELPDTAIIRVFPGAVKTRLVDEVLQANTEASTVFRAIRERGELAEPQHVAEFIVSILVDAPDDLVRKNDAWDYNCETDREQIAGLRKPVPPDATEK